MARKPSRSGKKPTVSLIVTDDKDVRVRARPGQKLHVVQVEHLTPDLKKAARVGSRLCGYGSNICLAIVDLPE